MVPEIPPKNKISSSSMFSHKDVSTLNSAYKFPLTDSWTNIFKNNLSDSSSWKNILPTNLSYYSSWKTISHLTCQLIPLEPLPYQLSCQIFHLAHHFLPLECIYFPTNPDYSYCTVFQLTHILHIEQIFQLKFHIIHYEYLLQITLSYYSCIIISPLPLNSTCYFLCKGCIAFHIP